MKKIIYIAAIAFAGCNSSTKEVNSSPETSTSDTNQTGMTIEDNMPPDRRNTDSTVNDVIDSQTRDSNINPRNR